MNLLPEKQRAELKKGMKTRFLVVVGLLSSILLLVGVGMLLPAYFLTREHFVSAVTPKISTKTGDEDLMKNILELPNEINTKLVFFQNHINSKRAIDLLSQIVSNMPINVKLNSIFFSKNESDKGKKGINIVISGVALDRESLVSFGAILLESKSFTSVEVPVSSLTREKDLPFSMNLFVEI